MDFSTNKAPVEIINEGAFGGTRQILLHWGYQLTESDF